MEARRFPEPEVVGSIPTAGGFGKDRSRQDSNLRGQSPVDFWSTPLTAWVRLLLIVAALAQLGERQTEDLKVPGSIPGGGTLSFCNVA